MAQGPWDIALGDLRDHRGARRIVRRSLLTKALEADVDSRIPAGADVEVDLLLESFDGGLSATGIISARWEGDCRRCLRGVGGELTAQVRELFRRGSADDEGTYPLGEDHVNIAEMVADSLFSALPVLPLCKQDCLGICPTCGADRNVAPCACTGEEGDPRWSALDALLPGQREPVVGTMQAEQREQLR